LRERPARNDVGDRHTIDFAPLQFLEKTAHIKCGPILTIISLRQFDRQIGPEQVRQSQNERSLS
jgi:hypothetical protein